MDVSWVRSSQQEFCGDAESLLLVWAETLSSLQIFPDRLFVQLLLITKKVSICKRFWFEWTNLSFMKAIEVSEKSVAT